MFFVQRNWNNFQWSHNQYVLKTQALPKYSWLSDHKHKVTMDLVIQSQQVHGQDWFSPKSSSLGVGGWYFSVWGGLVQHDQLYIVNQG